MANRRHALNCALAAALTSVMPHPAMSALASVPSVLQIRALSSDEAELQIYGDIGESWYSESVSAKTVAEQIRNLKVSTIQVRINSAGGSVTDGLAIYNVLVRHPARKIVTIDGVAASISSLIAMAGNEIVMPAASLLMVHAPWAYTGGNAAYLREFADSLDKHAKVMATAYVTRTGRTEAEIEALLFDGKDHWFTASEAIEFGLATSQEPATAAESETASAAGLHSLFGLLAKAPTHIAAGLHAAIARTALPAFARIAQPIQAAVLAALPEETPMKKQLQMIYANGAGPAAGAPSPTPPAAPAAAASAADGAVQAAQIQAMQERNRVITTMFAALRNNPEAMNLERAALADPTQTVAQVGERLMALIGQNNEPLGGQDPIVAAGGLPSASVIAGRDERDLRVVQATNGIIARAGRAGENDAQFRQGNAFASMSLLSLGEDCLIRAGVSATQLRRMGRMELANAILTGRVNGSQTTSDFPIILENTLNKLLQRGYTLKQLLWSRIARRGSLSDLRPHVRYHDGSFSSLAKKNEAGEYERGTMSDGAKETVTGSTKGRILSITRDTLINDELGVFANAAEKLGQAANRTVEVDVFALLNENAGLGPTMSDGSTLFHSANHGNIAATGGAPSVATFDAARVLMGSQKEAGSNDYLDIMPAIWLGPMGLRGAADTTNGSVYDPDTANKLQRKNVAYGLVRDILDTPRLTGNPWYLFADPNEEAVLEVAFLDGNESPTLTQEIDFASSDLQWKVELIYSVGAVGYRGAVRNAGA